MRLRETPNLVFRHCTFTLMKSGKKTPHTNESAACPWLRWDMKLLITLIIPWNCVAESNLIEF
jgi:hypothetical protein